MPWSGRLRLGLEFLLAFSDMGLEALGPYSEDFRRFRSGLALASSHHHAFSKDYGSWWGMLASTDLG